MHRLHRYHLITCASQSYTYPRTFYVPYAKDAEGPDINRETRVYQRTQIQITYNYMHAKKCLQRYVPQNRHNYELVKRLRYRYMHSCKYHADGATHVLINRQAIGDELVRHLHVAVDQVTVGQ